MIRLKGHGDRGEPLIVEMTVSDVNSLVEACEFAAIQFEEAQEGSNRRNPTTLTGDALYGGRAKSAAANVRALERVLADLETALWRPRQGVSRD